MANPQFSMTGYEGAALYYERVAGDVERALGILEEAMSRAGNKRWKMLLKARWDRLQQKVIRRLKGLRRIFSRFEKLDVIFLAFITYIGKKAVSWASFHNLETWNLPVSSEDIQNSPREM